MGKNVETSVMKVRLGDVQPGTGFEVWPGPAVVE